MFNIKEPTFKKRGGKEGGGGQKLKEIKYNLNPKKWKILFVKKKKGKYCSIIFFYLINCDSLIWSFVCYKKIKNITIL